jgi:hypothetical protein
MTPNQNTINSHERFIAQISLAHSDTNVNSHKAAWLQVERDSKCVRLFMTDLTIEFHPNRLFMWASGQLA